MKNLLLWLVLAFAGNLSFPLFAQDNVSDKLTRERQEQTGTAITIIFDDSGSMNAENKLAQAKAAFKSWLKTVPEDYKMSLITFQDGGRIVIPMGEKNRENVVRAVGGLVASSATPICEALRLAGNQISERRRKVTPYERHVVLLFTDGQETQDPRGIDGVRQSIKALRAVNVEVAGVGFHGQGDYMDGVATKYYGANDEASLAAGLAKIDAEIGDTGDVVVTQEELKEMKTVVAESAAVLAAQEGSTPSSTSSGEVIARKKKGISPTVIILAVVGFLILRSLFRKR